MADGYGCFSWMRGLGRRVLELWSDLLYYGWRGRPVFFEHNSGIRFFTQHPDDEDMAKRESM